MLSFPAPSIIVKGHTTLLQNAALRKIFLHISHSLSLHFFTLPSSFCVYMWWPLSVCIYSIVYKSVPRSSLVHIHDLRGCVCVPAFISFVYFGVCLWCVSVCVSHCIPMGIFLSVLLESLCIACSHVKLCAC